MCNGISIVVLVYMFLVTADIENLFMCIFAILISFFGENI